MHDLKTIPAILWHTFLNPTEMNLCYPFVDFISVIQPARYENIAAWDYNQSKPKEVFSWVLALQDWKKGRQVENITD